MGDILSTKLWTKSNNGNSLLCNFLPTVSQKIRHYLWSCLFHSCFYLLDKCRFLVFPFIALLPEPASPASSERMEKITNLRPPMLMQKWKSVLFVYFCVFKCNSFVFFSAEAGFANGNCGLVLCDISINNSTAVEFGFQPDLTHL